MEACEPWVFRRNLLLSVCPAELFPTHQLLLSAGEDTLMLCGPFGCTATAACVFCCNSLSNTECASCGLGLLALCVCAQQRCWIWKSQGDCGCFCGVVIKGLAQLLSCPDKLKPSLALLLLCLPGAVFGSWWSTRPEGKGAHRLGTGREFHPKPV